MRNLNKIIVYFLTLIIFVSCGKTSSNELYLKVIETLPQESSLNVEIDTDITIKFNEEITKIDMRLFNPEKDGQELGVISLNNKEVIFTLHNNLLYDTKYKVVIYKTDIQSISNKQLEEDYSYVFTTKIETNTETNEEPIEEDDKKENIDKSSSTCSNLIPDMACSDISSTLEN